MGHDTLLYAREVEVVASVNDADLKENTTFLKVSYAPERKGIGGSNHNKPTSLCAAQCAWNDNE